MDSIARLHEAIDARAAALHSLHGARLRCTRGCASCCVDDLRVFEVEADHIRAHHAELLADGTPHPPGACAFLDAAGACRIYAQRPYVCRTQGLPLRWLDDEAKAEMRDICPLNEEGPAVESLPADQCWTLGPAEEALQRLQRQAHATMTRVRLRDLFGDYSNQASKASG